MENYSVTIAREYGSGGRIIGKGLAEEFGIAFYDKELISLAAAECGLHEDFIQTIEQKRASGFFYNSFMASHELPIPEQVFLAQSKVIKDVASKGSCVIIGRCADYVLGGEKNCVRFFIHAPISWRVEIVKDRYGEGGDIPEDFIRREDKSRASYYDFFTQQKWGSARNYNLCLDSSIGIAASVKVLKAFVEEFKNGGTY